MHFILLTHLEKQILIRKVHLVLLILQSKPGAKTANLYSKNTMEYEMIFLSYEEGLILGQADWIWFTLIKTEQIIKDNI